MGLCFKKYKFPKLLMECINFERIKDERVIIERELRINGLELLVVLFFW